MTWCAKNYIEMLLWVENSPDMNPIESLWNILKDKINRKPITIKRALIERLIQVWFISEKIMGLRKTLIQSMPKRIKAILDAGGCQKKYKWMFKMYYLNNGQQEISLFSIKLV